MIAQYPMVIIGDYNIISNRKDSHPIFDWKEQQPTYNHLYKENMPFFIDYAFTNTEVKGYKLYSWEETKRMSNHVPLVVEN